MHSTSAMEILDGEESYIAEVISSHGEVMCADQKLETQYSWKELKTGERISSFCAIKTRENSYLQLLLSDNSLIHVGEQSFVTINGSLGKNGKKFKSFSFEIGRGRLRILSYKNIKNVKTPWGVSQLKKGEFIWDVYELKNKLKVELVALSGSIILDGEELQPDAYELPPEKRPNSALTFDYPHLLYFGEKKPSTSYDIAFEPTFPERKIASVEIEDVIVDPQIGSKDDEVFEEKEIFEPITGEIWVHDIIYDEAVRVIEKAAYDKALELVPVALREASEELVWEVASRSVLKWGVKYAQNISNIQVPLAVKGSYLGKRREIASFYEKDAYKRSTEEIAQTRTYRAAKVIVLNKGYEKGWMEAKKYADAMMPKVVIPLVAKKIYNHIKPLGTLAVKKIIDDSTLIHTPNVDRLIEHLSQVAAKKYTQRIIDEYGPRYTKLAAQRAAREAARSAAEEIAFYMAKTSSKRAGKIMGDLLARERARKIARDVAQEAKDEEAENSQKRSRRLYLESQR
jgi:hypothetical protein